MLKTAIFVALLAAVGYVVVYVADILGCLKHHNKHHPGQCRKINPEGIYGSEDFEVTSDGLAFITSGVFIGHANSSLHKFLVKKGITGKILLYNLQKPDEPVVDLKIETSEGFNAEDLRPHGISLLEDKSKGEHLLYVVSHPIGKPDRIEKFRYLPGTKGLRHERSFTSEKFYTLNDLAVVEEDVFYVTNYLYFKNSLLVTLEFFLPFSLCDILYYDGTALASVVTGLNGPNGATLSPDAKFLYISLPSQQKIHVYSRDPKDGSLTLVQVLVVHTAADNFHLSPAKDALYTGAHPQTVKILRHIEDPESHETPSQVLRLPLKDGKIVESDITELFYDQGHLIGGSSIAIVYNDLLLIGSVIDNLVLCDLTGPLKALA